MTNIEKKIMTFLVFILVINCFLIFAYQSDIVSYLFNLNPENTSGTLIIFTLIGLHALFALITMCLSLNGIKFIYRFYILGLSLLAPILFLFINFRTIISYQTDSYYFLPLIVIFYNFLLKDRKKQENLIRTYIKTLINPLDSYPY
ncbi:hypothetical protein N9T02_00520 [Candidatus Actinomarina]|nr:hypothetical protein [Candidatus Actinomarina sp.]